jgi:hypothetical protein
MGLDEPATRSLVEAGRMVRANRLRRHMAHGALDLTLYEDVSAAARDVVAGAILSRYTGVDHGATARWAARDPLHPHSALVYADRHAALLRRALERDLGPIVLPDRGVAGWLVDRLLGRGFLDTPAALASRLGGDNRGGDFFTGPQSSGE